MLITGGCGFIGCNTAKRFRELGHEVTLLDDLSRPGADHNLAWLKGQGDFDLSRGDIRDADFVGEIVRQRRFDVVAHLAGQVAVTTSVLEPRRDFEVNALGTLNVLEAIRLRSPTTILLNASTNKVYGNLRGLSRLEHRTRYELPDLPYGVSETQPLDFYSPYGCSKGVADQYVADYARIYGLRTVNFRQSCIYGPRQFGMEEQGWVAWFIIAHELGKAITIYGDGKQVRDVLFVDDLVECYLRAIERIDDVAGMSFNIGGGPENTLSLLEFLDLLEGLSGQPVGRRFSEWRPGDQPVFVSDIREAGQRLGWKPQVEVRQGVGFLYEWISAHRALIASVAGVG